MYINELYKYLVYVFGMFLFLYIPNSLYSQNTKSKSEAIIIWQQNTKLKWRDFELNDKFAKLDTCIAQSTFLLFGYYEVLDTSINLNVYNTFIKSKSWKSQCFNEKLLQHEQIHFNIFEYYTRLIRYYLSKLDENKKMEIKVIYDLCLGMCENTQRLYDLETNYGENGKIQKKWGKEIKRKNKKLKKYYQEITDQEFNNIQAIITDKLIAKP